MDPGSSLLTPAKRHRSALGFRARRCLAPISAADLLSRVPAGTPCSQARGLRPADRRDLPRPSPRAFARGYQHGAIHGDAARPLPATAALGGDAVDATPPAATELTAHDGSPGVPGSWPAGALSTPHRPGKLAHRRSLSLPGPLLGIPSSLPRSQVLRHEPPVKAAPASKGRNAFHRQVPTTSLLALARSATGRAATGASTWPSWPSVRHAFTPGFAER